MTTRKNNTQLIIAIISQKFILLLCTCLHPTPPCTDLLISWARKGWILHYIVQHFMFKSRCVYADNTCLWYDKSTLINPLFSLYKCKHKSQTHKCSLECDCALGFSKLVHFPTDVSRIIIKAVQMSRVALSVCKKMWTYTNAVLVH